MYQFDLTNDDAIDWFLNDQPLGKDSDSFPPFLPWSNVLISYQSSQALVLKLQHSLRVFSNVLYWLNSNTWQKWWFAKNEWTRVVSYHFWLTISYYWTYLRTILSDTTLTIFNAQCLTLFHKPYFVWRAAIKLYKRCNVSANIRVIEWSEMFKRMCLSFT